MSLQYLLSFILVLTTVNGQTYTGSANVIGSNAVTISIDYDTNTVVLKLDGSSSCWYGFGFGNTIMDGTYAIIMEYNRNDLSQGLVWEFTLGTHRSGNIYKTPEITVLSDINDGQTRNVTIRRSIDGIYAFPSPPLFPSIPFIINIITAIGSIPADFQIARNAAHLSTNKASASIIMSPVTTETPTYAPTQTTNNDGAIQCTADQCIGQNIDCIPNNNEACVVECLSERACYNATMICYSDAHCLIDGVNLNSLTNANIIAPIGYNLNVLCSDVFTCQNTKIYATYSSALHMHCDGVKSCQDFEIFCPPHSDSKNCVIRGNIVDSSVDIFSEQTSMTIHAANSWNDVDLTQYSPRMALSGHNIMYCDLGACNITHVGGAWNCIETHSNCYHATTTNQPLITPVPTTYTTTNTAANCYISIGSAHTGNLDIVSTINCMDNTITFDITYKGYTNNWFGLVFNPEMFGDAIIFTTGKNNDRRASLYSYFISGKTLSNVVYQANKVWLQIAVILDIFSSNGLRIIFEMNLDETIWDQHTNVIQFNEAIGSSLMLEKHTTTGTNTFAINFIVQTTTASPTTQPPTLPPTTQPSMTPTVSPTTTNPTTATPTTVHPTTAKPTTNPTIICAPSSDNLSSQISTGNENNELIVMAVLNCMENTITFDVTYNNYNENWFGLIFSNQMNGKAIIYTSGLSGDASPSLYSYDIVGRTPSDILYNENGNWVQILTEIGSKSIHIVYQQELSKTDWNQNTKQIIFRYAIGSQLLLQYHQFRSDQVFTLNLNAITSTTYEPTKVVPTNIITATYKPETTSSECPFGDILNGAAYTEILMVNITLNCVENNIIFDITYHDYNNNWFGLVFNDEMHGDAVIFTTGFYNDLRAALYSYNIYGKYPLDIQYDAEKNWIETVLDVNTNNGIRIKYKQDLDKTQWNKSTNEIQFRYAIGSSLFLAYHSFQSQQTYNIYLNELIEQHADNIPIVCNEDSMCSDTVVKCTNDNTCVINCVSAQSCMNTLFECTNGYDCFLNCIGYESCKQSTIQCADYSNCYIHGAGEKSLYEMQINGQLHTHLLTNNVLTIECIGDAACSKALIAGGYSDKLDIVCSAAQSCNFIKIQCPPFAHEANCKIVATIEESVGDQIDIFATNSWMDIDNSSYLPPTTTLGMFCGTMYSNRCLMQINNENTNEWNCDSKISQCYVDIYQYNLPVFIIRCDTDQPCYNKIVSCDNDEYKICRIICNGFGSCSDSDIICSAEKCEIICNGDSSCSDIASIQCGTNAECDIECYGHESCTNISIECGLNGNCNINGMDKGSLTASNIKCFENSNCDINCNEYGACNDVVIYGKDSNSMDILCVNNSCNNIELHCPATASTSNEKQCIISGRGDVHSQLILYCANGWNDIDLTNYFCILNNSETIVSKMYCGDALTDFCIIQMVNGLNGDYNDWNCIDEESICYLPPVPPPPQSSISTTMNDNDNDKETTDIPIATNIEWSQSELIALIVICCLVLVIMCLLGIYCWWCKPNKIKNKYKNVNNTKKKNKKKKHDYDDDDDDDIQPIQLDYVKNNAIVEIDKNL